MEQYLSIAIKAATEAAQEIMRIYTDPAQDFGIERKADNSPLTLADKAAHRCIVRYLEQTPYPILSEEGIHLPFEERQQWNTFWLVDPLDGTKEFIKKNGEFTVNIALVQHGTPLLGVIVVPAQNVLYYGAPHLGAYKLVAKDLSDLKDLNAPSPQRLPLPTNNRPYTIVASRSHLSPETQAYIDQSLVEHPDTVTISAGSSLKICLVAEGAADAYPRFAPTMEWDTAAGHAIALHAGCQILQAGAYDDVPSQDGAPLIYNKQDLHNPWFLVRR